MFQFRRFPAYTYLIQCTLTGYCPAGLPHSEIPGSMDICSSPRLIAACHVLLRLLMPRHSPCALSSLTNQKQFNICSRCELCRLHRFFFEIVIVTHLYDVPQLKLKNAFHVFSDTETSLLPYLSLSYHCSVFKVQSLPTSLEVRLKCSIP